MVTKTKDAVMKESVGSLGLGFACKHNGWMSKAPHALPKQPSAGGVSRPLEPLGSRGARDEATTSPAGQLVYLSKAHHEPRSRSLLSYTKRHLNGLPLDRFIMDGLPQ